MCFINRASENSTTILRNQGNFGEFQALYHPDKKALTGCAPNLKVVFEYGATGTPAATNPCVRVNVRDDSVEP